MWLLVLWERGLEVIKIISENISDRFLLIWACFFLSLWGNYFRWYTFCFWSSTLAILGQIGTVGFTLFPLYHTFLEQPEPKPNRLEFGLEPI